MQFAFGVDPEEGGDEVVCRVRHQVGAAALLGDASGFGQDHHMVTQNEGLYTDLSPGSLLMWKNIGAAREYCAHVGKEMRFSMGLISKDWAYKLRWADAFATGKIIF